MKQDAKAGEILLTAVQKSDAVELIAANCANRLYHAPWCAPFIDQPGFDLWFDAA